MPLCLCRYDVELYQRIEHLIGKKLPLYKTEEQEVMQLMERVTEAQRYAKMVRAALLNSCFVHRKILVEQFPTMTDTFNFTWQPESCEL